jgi:sigma-B regulation protein RsbU (phosphoserine phosphatase)
MARLNRVLGAELDPGQFATALAVAYENSGRTGLVNAGHPPPVICSGDSCMLLELDGMALGIDSNAKYSQSSTQLEPGGVFVAYTDGIVEARRGSDMFGYDRLMDAVAEVRELTARHIVEHLIDVSLRHCGGKFLDDVAVLVLKRSK